MLSTLLALTLLAPAPASHASAAPPPSGIVFIEDDYRGAMARARAEKKPLFLDSWATWCHSCLSMRSFVFPDAGLRPAKDAVVWLAVETEAEKNRPVVEKFPADGLPTFLLIDPFTEQVIGRWLGTSSVNEMRQFVLDTTAAWHAAQKGVKVSEAAGSELQGHAAQQAKNYPAAAAAYRRALALSAKDDPLRPARVSLLASALARLKTPEGYRECVALAALHNPVFYERQKLRLSTYRTPRFIRCYEEDTNSLVLPRGVLEEVRGAVTTADRTLAIQDLRPHPPKQTFTFMGTLTPIQEAAIRPFLHHDYGVLVAPPGAGKTVMACAIAAQRSVPTLILVHRKPLMEQWRMQISALLGIAHADIGEISGTTHRRTGMIDLAMVQSLRNLSEDEALYRAYGLLIVDECHHVPAFNFESIMKRVAVQAVLGLTATPYRRDGLQDLIVMQCGPVRHTISSRSTTASGELTLEVLVRNTGLTRPADQYESIQEVFHALGQDDARLQFVTEDVMSAVRAKRRCLVLSERKEHCRLLSEQLVAKGILPFVVDGSVKKSVREAILDEVRILPPEQAFVLIATGQYLGEGFDCPQADTLFLTFPISFKGKLIQYLGRIMRPYPGKIVARVYDYADVSVPVLRQMHLRRLKTYAVLGAHGLDTPSDQGNLSFS